MKGMTKLMLAFVIIGAINWGLVGFFNWNLVNAIFGGAARGDVSGFSRVVYAIVGLCGIGLVFTVSRLREIADARDRRLIPPTSNRTEVRP